ncbi:MAG: potassium channel family protein [Bacteroidota bacterium]
MNAARNALQIVYLLLLILVVGTLGYHFIEGWSLFDSLYMSVITLATVGYEETHPPDNLRTHLYDVPYSGRHGNHPLRYLRVNTVHRTREHQWNSQETENGTHC